MRLNFVKASPCRNTTVFITDAVERAQYAAVARLALDSDYLAAEQVGFIKKAQGTAAAGRLEMSGGEFCGNATLAFAAWLVRRDGVSAEPAAVRQITVECSGALSPIKCKVTPLDDEAERFRVREELQLEAALTGFALEAEGETYHGTLVREAGITHFLVDSSTASFSLPVYTALLNSLEAAEKADAYGIIPYRREEDGSYRIRPYVSVPASGSRVFEQACGSGSMALGLLLAAQSAEPVRVTVRQPGGSIEVEKGEGKTVYITTEVYFPCEGTLYVPE